MSDPFPHPTRTERRGEFPEHVDPPGVYVLGLPFSRADALSRARQLLADWVADRDHRTDHGYTDGDQL